MKKLCALILLTGCSRGMIDVNAVDDLVYEVANRHDVYVAGDQNISEGARVDYLRSTELLRKIMEEASE